MVEVRVPDVSDESAEESNDMLVLFWRWRVCGNRIAVMIWRGWVRHFPAAVEEDLSLGPAVGVRVGYEPWLLWRGEGGGGEARRVEGEDEAGWWGEVCELYSAVEGNGDGEAGAEQGEEGDQVGGVRVGMKLVHFWRRWHFGN